MNARLAAVVMACAAIAQPADDPAAMLTAQLREQAPLYSGRTPSEVSHLRARVFVRLAEIGVPRDALPFIIAELAQGHQPRTLAAAARAAAAAGPDAAAAAAHLIRLLQPGFHDEQLSLDDNGMLTSVRIEAVRALGAIGPGAGEDALAALRALDAQPGFAANRLGNALHEAIETAAARIAPPSHDCHIAAAPVFQPASAWLAPKDRRAAVLTSFRADDQSGRAVIESELADKPVALTFFYTRCDNDRKCSLNLSRLAQLEAAAESAGLSSKVRLLAITYDPAYDTPLQLARFGQSRGLRAHGGIRLLRSTPAALDTLVRSLGLGVNFADGRPNIHGVELFVLDRDGRVAREYRNASWDEREVLADLQRLTAEPGY